MSTNAPEGGPPRPPGSATNNNTNTGTSNQQIPVRIAIPSFKEVKQAERDQRQQASNFFRPSSGTGAPPQRPNAEPLGSNPLDFLDSSRPPGYRPPPSTAPQSQPSSTGRPQPPPPPQSHAHAHYQQHPYQPQQPQHGLYRSPGHIPSPAAPMYNPRPAGPQFAPRHSNQGQQPPPLPPPRAGMTHVYNNNNNSGGNPNPNVITVSRRQEGNPLLRYIRSVRWVYGDIVPDYVVGTTTAVIFISLRFHLLKPEYIFSRMKEIGRAFRLRVVLCHVDTEDAVEPLGQVTRAAIGNDFTLLCGFNNQECARYLETLKVYEKKPAEVIQKDVGHDYLSKLNAALTTVRGVNKTDVKTLGDRFGSVAAMFKASQEELLACPGIGSTKARRLFETFHEPFRKDAAAPSPAPAPTGPLQHHHQQQQEQQQQQQPQQQASEVIEVIDVEDEEGLEALIEAEAAAGVPAQKGAAKQASGGNGGRGGADGGETGLAPNEAGIEYNADDGDGGEYEDEEAYDDEY